MTLAAKHGTGALELRGVRRQFGSLAALGGVDLRVEEGEFIALLGPSGCGKSTALNCIAGLLPLTGGSIWLGERRIDQLRPEDRGFGMVFQSYALFPHMSVRKNVGFGLAMQGVKRAEAERRVDEGLALVRLQSQAGKLPGQLSGGQQQRVAIARAVVIEPAIVLMDEPLSNLDAKLRLEMRVEIRRIHDTIGSTTIYVTHDQDEALSMADRIVVMRDGVVRQVGTPEDLYERPLHADVADFMGYRNRVAGRVAAAADGRAEVEVCGTTVRGIARDAVKPGAAAVVSIRPEDLVASVDAGAAGRPGIPARVTAIEYRGRAFFGTAAASDGSELFFRADRQLARDEPVRLVPSPDRTLVFSGTAA